MKTFFVMLLGLIMCAAPGAFASVSVTVNGTSYTIPQNNEKGWGTAVTSWIQQMSTYTLQPNGGAFTLTADVNFGSSFGLKGPYLISSTSTPATAGMLRMAKSDLVEWRNNANGANLALGIDASDNLTWGGSQVMTGSLGTANQIFGTNSGATAFESKAVTATSAGTLTIPTGQVLKIPDGTVSAPSLALTTETGSGLYKIGTAELGMAINGAAGLDQLNQGSFVNYGLGSSPSSSALIPFVANRTQNSVVAYQFGNASLGTSSATQFQMTTGTGSGHGILMTAFDDTYVPNTYLGQYAQLQSDFNMLGLNIGTGYASGTVAFTFGTPSAAHESLNINATTVTIPNSVVLAMKGSTSGTISFNTQTAAGTYNFNWPITAGSAGQVLTSQGGGSTAMTWSSVLTNPMTTTGDIIYSSDNSGTTARLGIGTKGQMLIAGATIPTYQTPNTYNFIVNGALDYWQVGTSATVTATGGATPTATYLYQADQWYVNNILGGGSVEGVITFSKVAGGIDGSGNGASVKITTAPTGTGIQNGTELYTVLSNKASLPLYNKTASFSVSVKALGNVNQVGCQFYYGTTEVKPTNAIGSEQTVSVSTGSFATCSISGQALGTSQTVNGVIGVRIRTTTVSSGNTYDLNNGFVIEQAMLNLGSVPMPFQRQFQDPMGELAALQYFYEKSYDLTTAPGTSVGLDGAGGYKWQVGTLTSSTAADTWTIPYRPKRATPTFTTYSTDGTINTVRDRINSTNRTPTITGVGLNSAQVSAVTPSSATTTPLFEHEWIADARI